MGDECHASSRCDVERSSSRVSQGRGCTHLTAGQAVEILVSEGWLQEPRPELAAACSAISGVWSAQNRALLAASVRTSLEVERQRDVEAAASEEEVFPLFDDMVAEWPENFGFD